MKKVIIMLTAYNGEKYIAEQVQSILEQSYANLKILIRDDGSSDTTVDIITELAKKDNRIEIILDELGNLRQCRSFNTLIGVAIRDYSDCLYMFSDHDDYWYPTKIEEEVAVMLEGVPCLAYSNYEVTDAFLNVKSIAYNTPIEYTMAEYRRRIIMQNWIMGCTVMVNFELLKLSYPIAESADNHDQHIATVASFAGRIVYIDSITTKHRIHANNVTTRQSTSKKTNKIKRVLSKIANRKTMFEQAIAYGRQLRASLSKCKGIQESDLIDDYIEIYRRRGAAAKKIFKSKGFSKVDRLQNKILLLQLTLK